MLTLGELERSVMDLLWAPSDATAASTDQTGQTLSAYELRDRLALHGSDPTTKKLAATTILTVLSRLEKKGFVERERAARPHRYRAAASRADHMAELMYQVLGDASDRTAVLERFIGRASQGETDTLRKLLESTQG